MSACHLAFSSGLRAEQVHAVADGVAGGVVAGDRQEYEKRGQFVGSQHVLTKVVVDQRGGEVVARDSGAGPRPARSSSPASSMPAPMSAPRGSWASLVPIMSGSPAPRITLVALRTVPNSLRGMPIMSQMISSGNGWDTAFTRSTSPASHMPSMTSVQIRSTDSRTPAS